ncbi:MAG: outer membrane beta-barrel protein [Bacteroidales bacterium]
MKHALKIILVVVSVFLFNNLPGQTKLSGGMGIFNMIDPYPASVNSDFGKKANIGLYLTWKYGLNEKVYAGINTGYYVNSYEDESGRKTEYYMPILGIIEYRFGTNDFVPYVAGNIGLYRIGMSGDGVSESSGNFGFAASAGFDYHLSPQFFLHGCMYYHYINIHSIRTSAFGFNGGVGFRF